MEVDRAQVKANARGALKANYWPIIGWTVLCMVIFSACSGLCWVFIGIAAVIIIYPVITSGLAYFMYKSYRLEKAGGAELFAGFNDMGHVIGGIWWMYLFTWLWSLLFVIPGIVKAIAYSMTPYILIDKPEIKAKDALKLSMDMTRGHKGEIFVMYLSFIGWAILGSFTFGILDIFYVGPYISLTMAGYYEELKYAFEQGNTNPYGDGYKPEF